MIKHVFQLQSPAFLWMDVVSPTEEDYAYLTGKYKLHPESVKDCLAPAHLPKHEFIGDTQFIISRIFDVNAPREADETQKLTNKVAVFIGEEFLITIHRREEPFLSAIKEKWANPGQIRQPTPEHLVNQLLNNAMSTFSKVIEDDGKELEAIERKIFEGAKGPEILKRLYVLKRRSSVFKRMLILTKDTVYQVIKTREKDNPFSQDLIDTASSLYFMAEGLHEEVNNLLNLHLSLASHRTNEIMGVLTMFSVFLLPLTFIAGLYGMNFKYMPELDSEYGYPVVVAVMCVVVLGTYTWFRRRRWI